MPRLIIEKVFTNLNNITNFNYDQIENQLLLYIYGKGKVGKNRVVQAIELEYTLLLQNSDLVIIALMGATTNNIGNSIIYISFVISVKKKYRN